MRNEKESRKEFANDRSESPFRVVRSSPSALANLEESLYI